MRHHNDGVATIIRGYIVTTNSQLADCPTGLPRGHLQSIIARTFVCEQEQEARQMVSITPAPLPHNTRTLVMSITALAGTERIKQGVSPL